MKLTFESTGEVLSAGGTSVYHYPIASGVPQNAVLSDMQGVTSLSVRISRNGVVAASAQMVIYEGMTFNVSAMALAIPPLNALPRVAGIAIDVTDVVTLVSTQNGAQTSTAIKVVSLSCENIGGMIGGKYGKNLYTGGVDSRTGFNIRDGVATTVPIDGLLGTMYTYRGAGSTWRTIVYTELRSVAIYSRVAWTLKIHNTSEIPMEARLMDGGGSVLLSQYDVPPKTKVNVEQVFDTMGYSHVRMYIMVEPRSINRDAQCIVSEFGLYPNCAPPQWTPAQMAEDSPYVGYLTDYRDGWGRKPYDNASAEDPKLNGLTSSARILFKEKSKTYRKYPDGNVDLGTIFNGNTWRSIPSNDSFYNTNGSLYGCGRWKDDDIRQPPSCRVQLRWLNTKGAYDFMLFDTYKVVPVMNKYNTGGNAVDYYDVTVQRDIDGINDDALLQLTKSSEVNAILPDNCSQWGTATVVGNNTYSKTAGSTTQIMTIKLKVTL